MKTRLCFIALQTRVLCDAASEEPQKIIGFLPTTTISLTKLAAALVGFHLEVVDRVAIQECLYLFANPFLNIQPCCLHPSNESLENIRSHSGRGGNAAQERLEP